MLYCVCFIQTYRNLWFQGTNIYSWVKYSTKREVFLFVFFCKECKLRKQKHKKKLFGFITWWSIKSLLLLRQTFALFPLNFIHFLFLNFIRLIWFVVLKFNVMILIIFTLIICLFKHFTEFEFLQTEGGLHLLITNYTTSLNINELVKYKEFSH